MSLQLHYTDAFHGMVLRKKSKKQTKSESAILLQIDSAELRFLSAMPTFVLDIRAPNRHQGSLGLHTHI